MIIPANEPRNNIMFYGSDTTSSEESSVKGDFMRCHNENSSKNMLSTDPSPSLPISVSSSSSSLVDVIADTVTPPVSLKTKDDLDKTDRSKEPKKQMICDASEIGRDDGKSKTVAAVGHSSQVKIGGPGSVLPNFVESCLAWALALSCLLVACWYYYIGGKAVESSIIKNKKKNVDETTKVEDPLSKMPLMTHCPRELLSVSTVDGLKHRYQQLETIIQANFQTKLPYSPEEFCVLIRSNEKARRLTSLIMVQRYRRPSLWRDFKLTLYQQINMPQAENAPLIPMLESIWPAIATLPAEDISARALTRFEISVIVPLYKENGNHFAEQLTSWMKTADDPKVVQFVIVNAGLCTDMDFVNELLANRNEDCTTNSIRVLDYDGGGGRGPCLNFGANNANGRIFTFLHADTRLSPHWDTAIREALRPNSGKEVTTFCAFSFAIDRNATKSSYCPPGLKAIETTANLRCRLFQLPYGDQCLSIPRYIFEFVGGYPDQCLMEDYELVQLLRQRSRITINAAERGALISKERFKILPLPAFCSPRRWQSFGVLYVTYTNSRIVQLYNTAIDNDGGKNCSRSGNEMMEAMSEGGFTWSSLPPDEELYCKYYGTTSAPPRKHPYHSPWELPHSHDNVQIKKLQ